MKSISPVFASDKLHRLVRKQKILRIIRLGLWVAKRITFNQTEPRSRMQVWNRRAVAGALSVRNYEIFVLGRESRPKKADSRVLAKVVVELILVEFLNSANFGQWLDSFQCVEHIHGQTSDFFLCVFDNLPTQIGANFRNVWMGQTPTGTQSSCLYLWKMN